MRHTRVHHLAPTLAAVALMIAAARPAAANTPLGACCFQQGACQDLMASQCEGAGGDYIGEGTSCAAVNCGAPVAAPLLSAAGVVAAVSALLGVGAMRHVRRRRG